jgi:hypothetical protein
MCKGSDRFSISDSNLPRRRSLKEVDHWRSVPVMKMYADAQEYITTACVTYLSFDGFEIGFCATDKELDAEGWHEAVVRLLLAKDGVDLNSKSDSIGHCYHILQRAGMRR